MTIRLLLADDHAVFRGYLARLLAQQPGLRVVAQAGTAAAAQRALRGMAPSAEPLVLLTDVDLRGSSGVVLTRSVLLRCPWLHVLALSSHDDAAFVSAMAEAGALGYALKGDPLPELVNAIAEVAAGHAYRSPSLV